MSEKGFFRLTAVFALAWPIITLTAWIGLWISFDYPDIFREPAGFILSQYNASANWVTFMWFLLALSMILLIPLAVMFHKVFKRSDTPYVSIGTTFGVIAGLVNFMGILRWISVVDGMSAKFVDPSTSESTKEIISVVFDSFHQYQGITLGETFGSISLGVWLFIIGIAMLGSYTYKNWLAWLNIIAGLGLFSGILLLLGVGSVVSISSIASFIGLFGIFITGIYIFKYKATTY